MPNYYKLAPQASMFWDEGQSVPENKKLIVGEVKPLEPTERVMSAKRGGGIEEVSEADYNKAVAAKEELEKAANEAAQARAATNTLSTAQPVYVLSSESDVSKQLATSLKNAQEKEANLATLEAQYKEKLKALDESAAQLREKEQQTPEGAPATGTKKVQPKDEATAETPRTKDQ